MTLYCTYLGNRIRELEALTSDHERLCKQKKTDDTIKQYILLMEEKLEQSMLDITQMRQKIDEFEKSKFEELSQIQASVLNPSASENYLSFLGTGYDDSRYGFL